MAVPGAFTNYLRNTTGGVFVSITEGGTVLGNTSTGTAITKALALKDNATIFNKGTLPKHAANGLIGNHKPLTAGTFAYEAAGKYVIAASSDTLSGVSKTNILITGQGTDNNAIHQFIKSYGAKTLTAFRANRFSWTNTKSYGTAGASLASRINWVAATSGGGNTATAPDALNEDPWNPVAGATAQRSDSAANPTRAIPGELVMKVDFVTLTVAAGGDFFDYKAITGM